MLQKLLIALCTIFVLSACGGDLDLRPSQTPDPDTDTGGDDGDGEEGENEDDFEPGQPIYTYIPFDEEADIEGWSSRCLETCNATATLSWNSAEEVLAAEPQWASDSDQLDIFGTVDEVADMTGDAASIWVFVTEDYVTDGNMSMHLLLGNAEGLKGVSRAYAPELGWNRIEMWELEAGTGDTEVVDGEETTDYGTFLWHDDGFTLMNINEIGVRFLANGKAPGVDGQIWFDNVTLTPAPEEEAAPFSVDMSSENWVLQDGGALTLQRGDGTVFFNPDGTQEYAPKPVYMVSGPADLSGQTFTVTFSVDEAYIASGAAIDAIVQQNFGSYQGNFEGDAVCQIPNSELVAGEETDIVCEDLPDFAVAAEGEQLRVGLQVPGDDGVVTIHAMTITGYDE